MNELVRALNKGPDPASRLEALRALADGMKPETTLYVNNHIHTTYSFSPYSPAGAAYMAWKIGLRTAGIMDHDSVAGAEEFLEAGALLGIAATVGFECRCSVENTPFEGFRLNNPDQKSVAYLAMHGIPHQNISRAQAWLTPYRKLRNSRNRGMTQRLSRIMEPWDAMLDFERDVVPLSLWEKGGSVTERHILYALARKLMERIQPGPQMVRFLEEDLALPVGGKTRERLEDPQEPMYDYYLLGLLKSGLVKKFYIDADDELPPITDFIQLAEDLGAIPAYAYLGDVQGSVTGDKKDQSFEDAFLDKLVKWLADSGFRAITYMPTRNTRAQLERIRILCDRYGLFQISGEDINSPFQSFVCPALDEPEHAHLVTSTWALIGHEQAATENPAKGMFSHETMEAVPGLAERVRRFAEMGRQDRGKKGSTE